MSSYLFLTRVAGDMRAEAVAEDMNVFWLGACPFAEFLDQQSDFSAHDSCVGGGLRNDNHSITHHDEKNTNGSSSYALFGLYMLSL